MLIDHVKDYSLCEVSNIDKYAVIMAKLKRVGILHKSLSVTGSASGWTMSMRYEVDGYHNIG